MAGHHFILLFALLVSTQSTWTRMLVKEKGNQCTWRCMKWTRCKSAECGEGGTYHKQCLDECKKVPKCEKPGDVASTPWDCNNCRCMEAGTYGGECTMMGCRRLECYNPGREVRAHHP